MVNHPTKGEVDGVTVSLTVPGHVVRSVVELPWDMYGCEFEPHSLFSYGQQLYKYLLGSWRIIQQAACGRCEEEIVAAQHVVLGLVQKICNGQALPLNWTVPRFC